MLSRVRNYGGDLEIAPTISLLDDEFEMVLFEGESSLGFLKYMLAVVVHQQQTMRGITILRTRQAVFSAPAGFEDPSASGRRVCRRGAGACGDCSQCTYSPGPARFSRAAACQRPSQCRRRRMDNLTHSLTGLMLSRAGLNRFYPRATLVLVVSANIPDIDFVAIARGPLYYFEQHRGITHSIAAAPVMALLSVLVACAFGRTMRGWAAAWGVACIGVASHLLLDWTNTYGIRLLLPFLVAVVSFGSD